MTTQDTADNTRLSRKPKLLLALCLIAFTLIQERDGMGSLPLILWGWVGFAMGEGYTRLIGGLFILSWLSLWTLLFYRKLKLDSKLIGPLLALYIIAVFHAHRQFEFYRLFVGHWDAKVFNFIITGYCLCDEHLLAHSDSEEAAGLGDYLPNGSNHLRMQPGLAASVDD